MDRLHSMRVFCRVIDSGSFAAAARAMKLSPAVVTRLVADLEEHLGARLINRTTRRLSLTNLGEAYLERTRQIVADVDEAEALAATAGTEPRGHLRVSAPAMFAVHQLVKHLARFRASFPQISIELSLSGPVDTVVELVDVSIVSTARRSLDAQGVTRRLATAEVVACAAPAYLERRGRPENPSDLLLHETLLASPAREVTLLHGPATADKPPHESVTLTLPRPALAVTHAGLLRAAALQGLGIAALPSFVAEEALREGRLERVLPHWHFSAMTWHAAMPARRHLPARTRAFVDFLAQTFAAGERDPWLAAAGCETRRAAKTAAAEKA